MRAGLKPLTFLVPLAAVFAVLLTGGPMHAQNFSVLHTSAAAVTVTSLTAAYS
jgi:hypothetical protein